MKTRCFFFSLSSIFPEFSVFLGRSFVEGEEADMSGTWTMVDIAGRPGHVYEPPGGRPSLAVLYLHDIDAASLAERPAFTRALGELGLGCVCPQAGPSWWVDRLCPVFGADMTPERYLLDQVVPYFNTCWKLPSQRLGLLGIGMGGQGVLRLAFRHPRLFAVVAALAAAIDFQDLYGRGTPLDDMYDSREQCRQDTAVLQVQPSDYPPHLFFAVAGEDPWYRGNDRLHEKLNALGIAHEVDFTTQRPGPLGNYLDHLAERALRFLHAGLVQQSRRLL